MVTLIEDELLNEITEINRDFVNKKLDLEEKKANLWINTDWVAVLGKGKPTLDDKKEWIKLQTVSDKREVEQLEIDLNHIKRVYNVKMKMIGESE